MPNSDRKKAKSKEKSIKGKQRRQEKYCHKAFGEIFSIV
jgi:hypothetical protein